MKRRRKKLTTIEYFRNNVKWFMMVVAIIFIAGIFVGPGFGTYGNLQCGAPGAPQSRQELIERESPIMASFGEHKFRDYNIRLQVDQRLSNYRYSNPGAIVPPEQTLGLIWSTLDQEIEKALKLEMAKKLDIKVSNQEVEEVYQSQKEAIIRDSGLLDDFEGKNVSLLQMADRKVQEQKAERAFLTFLSERLGTTPTEFKKLLRDNLLVQNYTKKLEEDAKEQVKEDARKRAIEIYNSIANDGADFAEITETDSDDYASSQNGGLVENMTRKDAKEKGVEYASALFTSELGKVQEPLETESGYYIFKVENRTIAEGEDYENAKDGIIADLKKELGIEDEPAEKEEKAPEPKEYSESELIDMATSEGITEPSEDKPAPTEDENQITEDMIKERYEKVTFRQIFIRPESFNTRLNENIRQMKKEANIEIQDPMMKAYSYVAYFDETQDFDSAIDGFKAIRAERVQKLDDTVKEWQTKKAESENASGDNKIRLAEEASFLERDAEIQKSTISEADYLIAYYMLQKINEMDRKRMEDSPGDIPVKPTDEEKALVDEMRKEMKTLLEEAVDGLGTPDPYYSAMLGDIYLLDEEWSKAHKQWAIVADYGSRELSLLQRAEFAYNQFLDNLDNEDERSDAGKEYDKLQKDLDAAREKQRKQQEEWQKQMMKMIEEETASEGG